MGLVTKEPITWKRSFSVFNDEIVFPAGTPVRKEGAGYWVASSAGQDEIIAQDLCFHGCRVAPDNVVDGEALVPFRTLCREAQLVAGKYLDLLCENGAESITALTYTVVFYDDGSPYRENDA